MLDSDPQCTVGGRESARGQRTFFMFKFFLSQNMDFYLAQEVILSNRQNTNDTAMNINKVICK